MNPTQPRSRADILPASRAALDHLKIGSAGVPVYAAATASAPVDAFVALTGVLNLPRKNDAPWLTTLINTPVRTCYGESDEAASTGLGQLAMAYQRAIGSGNERVEAISTRNTTHRGTFASALPQWKAWFDALSK